MSDAPGGLSDAEFKSWYVEAGDWLWGTVQGSFNEKQSVSQIVVDAVIGMIPLVGDVTAVRDIIAISLGMCDSPKKRESVLEWVGLVIMILALIPVLGGVIKGVGKLVVRAAKTASKMSGDDVAKILAKHADDIMEVMNRLGVGNAKKWFLDLRILDHTAEVLQKFNVLCDGMAKALLKAKKWSGWILPNSVLARMDQIMAGLKLLKAAGARMIPEAIKEFHGMLVMMQEYIRTGGTSGFHLATAGAEAGGRAASAGAGAAADASHTSSTAHATSGATPPAAAGSGGATPPAGGGGKPPAGGGSGGGKPPAGGGSGGKPPKKPKEPVPPASRSSAKPKEDLKVPPVKRKKPPKHGPASTTAPATAGKPNRSRAKEARLKHDPGSGIPPRSIRGGYAQNVALAGDASTYKHLYQHEPGYPDLTLRANSAGHLTDIEAFSGRMVNREARASDKGFYRFFGPGRTSVTPRGVTVTTKESRAGGAWWGVGDPPPTSAKEWREFCAVMDEWNDGAFRVRAIPPAHPKQPVKGVFGTVSEQSSTKTGQYLPGGYPQAVMDFPNNTMNELTAYGRAAMADGLPRRFECPITGFRFEIDPVNWPDAHGVHGYPPAKAGGSVASTVDTAPLNPTAVADKTNPETHIK
jgi:hypothetical protein